MEKNDILNETGKGNYKIEEAKDNDNDMNEVGSPPLVIVVQGGKSVYILFLYIFLSQLKYFHKLYLNKNFKISQEKQQ